MVNEYESKKIICTNCGKNGHEYKYCNEPITSFGIINFKIVDDSDESILIRDHFSFKKNIRYKIFSKKHPKIQCYLTDNISFNKNDETIQIDDGGIQYGGDDQIKKFSYYRNKIMFLMVSRKFSLGFIEFVRGKYDVSDVDMIVNLFEQMTSEEIRMIKKYNYDDLLYYFLNRRDESKESVLNKIYESKYSNEYCEAKVKFEILSNSSENTILDLNFYTNKIKPKWDNVEWGFPKGRRDKKSEDNISCAKREFEEETGFREDEYIILNKIDPVSEFLTGTNGVNYKHIYYLAVNNSNRDISNMNYDNFEIGDIKWFTYDEAKRHIRPYHEQKKVILTKIYSFIINYLVN